MLSGVSSTNCHNTFTPSLSLRCLNTDRERLTWSASYSWADRPLCCMYHSFFLSILLAHISKMKMSGFHRNALGRETWEIPQNCVGSQEIRSSFQVCRGWATLRSVMLFIQWNHPWGRSSSSSWGWGGGSYFHHIANDTHHLEPGERREGLGFLVLSENKQKYIM